MSVSYSYACSRSTRSLHCYVCLNTLESSVVNNPGWNIVGLPECRHVFHHSCFNHWASHSKELAKRDVSVDGQATCPLCKVKVEEKEDFYDEKVSSFSAQKPDPELPLPLLETPDSESQCDVQSLQALFDKAVSVEYSQYYFNVSNFPALHQMKNRYGITLSAEQLDKILNEALLTTLFGSQRVTVGSCAASKIRMVMFLRSDDDASKEVINNFFKRILDESGGCKDVIIDFLLDQEVSDRELLQKGFEYYIKNDFFGEAKTIHEKHGLHIEHEMLKDALIKAGAEYKVQILSGIAADSGQNFQQAGLEALKALNESKFDCRSVDLCRTKDAINALLDFGISDQTEVNKSLRLALLGDDPRWQDELQNNHGAVLEPQFLIEQLEGTEDSELVDKIGSLFELRANDDRSTAALIAALLRVVTVSCNSFFRYSDIECLLSNCLNAGIWSQELVNKALTQAMDADSYTWAKTLNKVFQAVLEPQILKDYLWKKLTSCPSRMSWADEGKFVCDVTDILSLANKNNNKQNDEVVHSVLNRLLENSHLSQRPVIRRCIKLLVEFNELRKQGS